MPTYNQIQRGRKAYSFGEMFETFFFRKVKEAGIHITRMPDGCRQFKNKIVRIKTPFDWILSYQTRVAFLDTKTTQSSRFSHSMIVDHQVSEMAKHEKNGIIAGYVIWLRETKEIGFISALYLQSIQNQRGSIDSFNLQFKSLGREQTFAPQLLFR